MTYAIVLQYSDRSGIQRLWGPYITETSAKRAQAVLETWPIEGIWEIHKLTAYMLPRWGSGEAPDVSP